MLRDSVVVVVVRTRPRAIPLAMITIRKSFMGFLFFPVMTMGLRLAALRAAGAPLLQLFQSINQSINRSIDHFGDHFWRLQHPLLKYNENLKMQDSLANLFPNTQYSSSIYYIYDEN